MTCPKCSKEIPGNVTDCPHCTPPKANGTKLVPFVLLAVGAGLLLYSLNRPKTIPSLILSPARANGGTESCLGKARCVLVYVAPWCGACKYSLPGIQALRDKWAD